MTKQTLEAKAAGKSPAGDPTKQQLEHQMQLTRESLAETVGEIKETVEQEYESVRKTVSGVIDYREEFKNEPLVWSLGALSAGFALGYTVGFAHKNAKRGKQSQLMAFADSMVDELSNMGQGLVVPVLSSKIKDLFGFDFSELLRDLRQPGKRSTTRRKTKPPKTAVKKARKVSTKRAR